MLQGMAAVALLVGYRTRAGANLAPALLDTDPPSTAVKWWRSFNADAAFLEYFSAAWCPLVNRRTIVYLKDPPHHGHFQLATVAIMLQMCFMYWVSGFTKTDPLWTETRWALYYALNVDHIANGLR